MELPIIILLGAARSGTTLLAERLIGRHPEVVYWSEPNHVWSRGAVYADHDRRLASEIDAETIREIRGEFEGCFEGREGAVLLEKTPANTLRVPFVRAIFPEARFIHLVRDGRDVAISAAREWRGGSDDDATSRLDRAASVVRGLVRQVAIRGMSSTLHAAQLPHYLKRLWEIVQSRVFGREQTWGPRIPNLEEIRRRHTLLETCAIQWRECVRTATSDLQEIDAGDWMELRYEDLLAKPHEEITRIFDFLDLELHESVRNGLSKIDASNTEKWRDALSAEQQRALVEVAGSTLEEFGYWTDR